MSGLIRSISSAPSFVRAFSAIAAAALPLDSHIGPIQSVAGDLPPPASIAITFRYLFAFVF